MHVLNKFSRALIALVVMLVPGIASANMLHKAASATKDLVVSFFGPSFVPNEDWWWLYLIVFLPLTYALFYFARQPTVKKVLMIIGRVGLIALAIAAIVPIVHLVIGVVTGILFSFIDIPPLIWGIGDWIEKAIKWALIVAVYIGLFVVAITMLLQKGTYTGAWGAIKAGWKQLGEYPRLLEVTGPIFLFMLLNPVEIGKVGKFSIPLTSITAVLGIAMLVWSFKYRDIVEDHIAIRKTQLTADGKVPCPYFFETGKRKPLFRPCAGRTDLKEEGNNCVECGSPLVWSCECGKKGISILKKRCPGKEDDPCGLQRPPLPNVPHTPTLPPHLVEAARKDKKVCPACHRKNPIDFNFCLGCEKDISSAYVPVALLQPPAETPTNPPPSNQLTQLPNKSKVKGLSPSQRKKSVRSC